MAKPARVLIDGEWRDSNADGSFEPAGIPRQQ